MDSNFSPEVKEIISFSREEAIRLGNEFIGTEHFLLGIIREGNCLAINILRDIHVDIFDLHNDLELAIQDKNKMPLQNVKNLFLTKQAEKVIRITVLEAKDLKSATVETEHLMLGILKNEENAAARILHRYNVSYDRFKSQLIEPKNFPSILRDVKELKSFTSRLEAMLAREQSKKQREQKFTGTNGRQKGINQYFSYTFRRIKKILRMK